MSRALSLARAIGSDGVLNVGDVAGLAAVASSGSASDLGTGTLPIARIADGAVTAAKLHTSAVTDKLGFSPVSGTARGVTVGGDANTYYPVAFTGFSERPCKISIWKHVHDYATWDGILEFEAEFSPRAWGGYIGNVRILRHRWSSKNFVANWASSSPVGSTFVVWLRGGGRNYSVATDYNETPTVYLTSTDLGAPPGNPWVVGGITSVQSKAAVDMNGVTAELLNVDGGGRVTMPFQPYAQASSDATSSGLINLNTHTASRGGLSIGSNRMTVPVAGAYVIGYHHLGNSGSGACQIEIRVNGSGVSGTATQDTNSSNDSFGTQVVRFLSANDYIEFWVIQGVSHGNPHYNSMWAYLLG